MTAEKTFIWILLGIIVISLSVIMFPGPVQKMTGHAATQPANATVDVIIGVSIGLLWDINSINWGTGGIAPGGTCTLETETANSVDCVEAAGSSFNDGTTVNSLELSNIGNADLYVYITSDKDADTFIPSTTGASFEYKVEAIAGEPTACGAMAHTTYGNLGVDPAVTADLICNQLKALSGANPTDNSVEIDIRIGIPSDAEVGARSALVIATGSEAAI